MSYITVSGKFLIDCFLSCPGNNKEEVEKRVICIPKREGKLRELLGKLLNEDINFSALGKILYDRKNPPKKEVKYLVLKIINFCSLTPVFSPRFSRTMERYSNRSLELKSSMTLIRSMRIQSITDLLDEVEKQMELLRQELEKTGLQSEKPFSEDWAKNIKLHLINGSRLARTIEASIEANLLPSTLTGKIPGRYSGDHYQESYRVGGFIDLQLLYMIAEYLVTPKALNEGYKFISL